MKINRNLWLFVGIVLWGIPTGVFLSLIIGSLKSGTLLEFGGFDEARFFKSLFISVPIFAFCGFIFGSYMANQMKGHVDGEG